MKFVFCRNQLCFINEISLFLRHVKIVSERSKESKEQKKNKESVLVAKSAYNAQFGLVMKLSL